MASKNSACFAVTLALCALCSCSSRTPDAPGASPSGDIIFWHTLRGEYADLFAKIVADFNAQSDTGSVQLQYVGSYDDVFRKCSLAIKGGGLPTLATAYESMVTEYVGANCVVDLDRYLTDPGIGFDLASVADIFPVFIDANRYGAFGNRLYSFPFTKSVLMVYYNAEMFSSIGCDTFPETWDALIEASRRIRDKFGIPAYSLSVDASTFDALVLSCGGPIITDDQRTTFFDAPHGRRAFGILAAMAKEKLLKTTAIDSYDDRLDFLNKRCAFHIRSSAHRPFIADLVGNAFRWEIAPLPVDSTDHKGPRTVLFGGNVTMFKSSPHEERTAWAFLKFFAEAPVTARWAVSTGYLPVRRSAVNTPELAAFFGEDPRNRRAFDALPLAGGEPKAAGWQAVRRIIEQTVSDVVDGKLAPGEAAQRLNKAAVAKLAGRRETE